MILSGKVKNDMFLTRAVSKYDLAGWVLFINIASGANVIHVHGIINSVIKKNNPYFADTDSAVALPLTQHVFYIGMFQGSLFELPENRLNFCREHRRGAVLYMLPHYDE